MGEQKARAVARVTVTLELKVGGTWGSDCKIDQVYKQAKDSAMLLLNQTFDNNRDVSISGKPKVEAIIIPENL